VILDIPEALAKRTSRVVRHVVVSCPGCTDAFPAIATITDTCAHSGDNHDPNRLFEFNDKVENPLSPQPLSVCRNNGDASRLMAAQNSAIRPRNRNGEETSSIPKV